MEAMMGMIKMDLSALETAARERAESFSSHLQSEYLLV
jgi:hypothetical protein